MPMNKQANPKNSGLSWGPRSRLDETGPQAFGSTYVERTLGIVMRIQQQQNITNTFRRVIINNNEVRPAEKPASCSIFPLRNHRR